MTNYLSYMDYIWKFRRYLDIFIRGIWCFLQF